MSCVVFIPDDLELGKVAGASIYRPRIVAVRGNYDDVNRLCTQVADTYGWGFANINLRAYYAEGAKTYGFEIAEQLGWRFPQHVVSSVAGGTLLPRILKAFEELQRVGLVDDPVPANYAAQAAGCAPVVRALEAGLEFPEPVVTGADAGVDLGLAFWLPQARSIDRVADFRYRVRTSARSGSRQYLSYKPSLGGTFYIQVRMSSPGATRYRLTVVKG